MYRQSSQKIDISSGGWDHIPTSCIPRLQQETKQIGNLFLEISHPGAAFPELPTSMRSAPGECVIRFSPARPSITEPALAAGRPILSHISGHRAICHLSGTSPAISLMTQLVTGAHEPSPAAGVARDSGAAYLHSSQVRYWQNRKGRSAECLAIR